jgi:GNAT superfamily N-acetyltransferase
MPKAPSIRPVQPGDDLVRVTDLIHAAYAPQAARGLRFWGTHQSVEDTAKRLASGHGLLAELNGEYVGTITVRPPQPESPVAIYRDGQTWTISQFAVAPSSKGRGLGKALHEAAVRHALRNGATVMALDTAAAAQGLIAMYTAWGYQPAGEHSWQPLTNYVSVLMRRPLVHPGMLSSTSADPGHPADA